MIPFADGPFATSAFHLLTVIDFICLVAGTYLLLILHDLERRIGYLLTAIALTVLALQIISAQLTLGDPLLQYVGETLSLMIAAILLAWGTLSLIEHSREAPGRRSVRRALLTGAATIAILGTLTVWALPFWDALRELVTRASADGGFVTFMNGLRVGVAAALVACTWITWERRVLGTDLSRMFGAAYLLWGGAIMIGVLPLWAPESSFWIRHAVWVLGSLFIGNALAVHVYRAERRALERQARLRLVDRVATAAITSPNLPAMVEAATIEVSELLDTRLVATYLIDVDQPDQLRLVHQMGDDDVELVESVAIDTDQMLARSLTERRPVELELPAGEDAQASAAAVPLTGLNEGVGVLVIVPASGEDLSAADLTALGNAGTQLGVIVEHMVLLEETRQARDHWRQTFDSITELVTVHDTSGRILLANSAVLSFGGVREEDVIGSRLCEVLGDCDVQNEMLQACISKGASPGADIHRTRGRIHQVLVTPLRGDNGGVSGCVRVARDVTSRWRAEERLAGSERRYRELAENANDIIYTHDVEGNFLYVNAAAVRILGYSQDQFSHMSFWDLVAPESMPDARRYLESLFSGETPEGQIELRMTCADDRVVVVQLRANLIRRDGQSETIHGIARDVTVEKQLAAQLIQAERLASAGTLIAGIAHELNNPLTTIGGYADLLSEELADTEAAAGIRTIAEEAERCRSVARSLLHFARQTDASKTRFGLNEVVQSVFDLRAYDLREAGISIETDLAEDLHELVGDYSQIQQVVYNLIDNAYHALHEQEGGVLVVRTWNEDSQVMMCVEDTGAGIPDDMLEHIFEPFVTSKPHDQGTGLGLSICRRILEGHHGTISASNRAGGGAVVTIALPTAGSLELSEARPFDRHPMPREAHAEVDRLHVLFIDDEPSLRTMVSEYLQRKGHEVTLAASGEEGLEIALAEDFDAIVCDMRLPGMNGDEVCSRLLEERPSLSDRIMVATGDILSPQVQDFFARTGLPHIHKPFKLVQLERNVVTLATGR